LEGQSEESWAWKGLGFPVLPSATRYRVARNRVPRNQKGLLTKCTSPYKTAKIRPPCPYKSRPRPDPDPIQNRRKSWSEPRFRKRAAGGTSDPSRGIGRPAGRRRTAWALEKIFFFHQVRTDIWTRSDGAWRDCWEALGTAVRARRVHCRGWTCPAALPTLESLCRVAVCLLL